MRNSSTNVNPSVSCALPGYEDEGGEFWGDYCIHSRAVPEQAFELVSFI